MTTVTISHSIVTCRSTVFGGKMQGSVAYKISAARRGCLLWVCSGRRHQLSPFLCHGSVRPLVIHMKHTRQHSHRLHVTFFPVLFQPGTGRNAAIRERNDAITERNYAITHVVVQSALVTLLVPSHSHLHHLSRFRRLPGSHPFPGSQRPHFHPTPHLRTSPHSNNTPPIPPLSSAPPLPTQIILHSPLLSPLPHPSPLK